jgi:hypothetical protein
MPIVVEALASKAKIESNLTPLLLQLNLSEKLKKAILSLYSY